MHLQVVCPELPPFPDVPPPEQVSRSWHSPRCWVDVFTLIKLYSHNLCTLIYYVILNKVFISFFIKNLNEKKRVLCKTPRIWRKYFYILQEITFGTRISTWLMGTDKRCSRSWINCCLALEGCVCVCVCVCGERRQKAGKALREVLPFS